ncbi:uncharacterized protein [Gossypium hirsutum]|uniref:Uncharacterized protein n=1 Tax=Gossypium hirsutum TaxID=3635 RepID=A0A1U8IB06_GOSHI|nr:uncharacterized protein LOC107894657 [Gossypium hirsutum]
MDLMVRSREETLEQNDQMAKIMEMMSALVKGKGPMNPDIVEPQSRVNLDQDPPHLPRFTLLHTHTTQRGYAQWEPTGLEQRPAPPANLGQRMFVSNPGASPTDPLVPDLDDSAEIARLKLDDHDAKEKYRSLEERLKVIESTEVLSALSAKKLSLVPDLVLPPKFKVPDFEKYDGTRCPKVHLIIFCWKMTGYKPTEIFKQYAQRWRDISAQVEPPLTKTEITILFINTLKALFYDKLVGSVLKDFADIVISGELIENAIKSGRMEGSDSSRRAAPVKKRELENHLVGTGSRYTPNPYPNQPRPQYHSSPNVYFPPQNPHYQTPPPYPSYPVYATNNQTLVTAFPQNIIPFQGEPKKEQRPPRPNPEKLQFTPIPVSYGELYPKLLEKQLISPYYMAPLKPPYPKWFDPNTSCAYHAGNQGHSTKNCLAFERRVERLIDAGILRFDGTGGKAGKSFPNHTEGNVSVVGEEDKRQSRR